MITPEMMQDLLLILDRAVSTYERSITLAERAYDDLLNSQNEDAARKAEATRRLEDELLRQKMQSPMQLPPIQQYTQGLGGLLGAKK